MACVNGRISPSPVTKLRLFADSGGYCANPECRAEIFRELDGEVIHIAEIAHIISAGERGPRSSAQLSDQEKSAYDNLILLCPTCHTMIDKAEDKFPEGLILDWKKSHKDRLAEQFGIRSFGSREEAREALLPLLRENRTIFEQYGPLTDERFNPESSMPRQWIRKIHSRIIPNNRKILGILDANRSLLLDREYDVVESFRQHVEDFEAKHLAGSPDNGRQFPVGLDKVFS